MNGNSETVRSAQGNEQEREEELSLLQTITMEVAAASDLASALEVVVHRVCEKTRWALGQAWVPNPEGTDPWAGYDGSMVLAIQAKA